MFSQPQNRIYLNLLFFVFATESNGFLEGKPYNDFRIQWIAVANEG